MRVFFNKDSALDAFQSVSDVTDRELSKLRPTNVGDKRSQVKIGVIDDQPFEARQNLKSHGYVIEELGDLKSVDEVEGYQILLCDLMGVGMFFDTTDQGASLIREMRTRFPAKFIAAYSGSSLNQVPVRKAKDAADDFIKKDADIETWVEKLDHLTEKATDPRIVWQRVREQLVRDKVDTRDLIKLEDAFVQALRDRDQELTLLKRMSSPAKIGGVASNIIQGMISSGIFKLIVG